MKLSTVVMGVGVGAFVLVGCGGDALPEPTAKITKADARKVAELAGSLAYITPQNIISNLPKSHGRLAKKAEDIEWSKYAKWLPLEQGTFEGAQGTKTITFTKGSPSDGKKKEADVAYTFEYKNFKFSKDDEVVKNGTIDYTRKYKVTNPKKWIGTWEWSSMSSDMTYSAKNAKVEVSSWDRAGNAEQTTTKYTRKEEIKFSCVLTEKKKKTTLQSIKINTKDDRKTSEYSVEGAIDSPDYDGWLVVTTAKPWIEKFNSKTWTVECTQGEIEIKGKDHTVTVVCEKGKRVTKFDGKVVKEKNTAE